jgi:hypothetical protein
MEWQIDGILLSARRHDVSIVNMFCVKSRSIRKRSSAVGDVEIEG